MNDTLKVRVYNVRFGDAILVTVPDRDPKTKKVTVRRILIDVGNAPLVASREGGDDSVFKDVVDDILGQLKGNPLDLYVMTHEHLDHAQGLPFAAWKVYSRDFLRRFKVDHVWMTASAAPDYYDTHPDAKKNKALYDAAYAQVIRALAASPSDLTAAYAHYVTNNNPASTKACVEFLRTLNPAKTHYIHRETKNLRKLHPFKEAKFSVWAPEEDTSQYYGRIQPLLLSDPTKPLADSSTKSTPLPPHGVDVGAFLNLVEMRSNGIAENLLAIDKAENNTSIVFLLEWRKWLLLFAGDAELKSWQMMNKYGVLKAVDFLKVSHHGSHNGTPDGVIFDTILPKKASGQGKRFAAISTWEKTYGGIPHLPTNERLKSRANLRCTLDDPTKPYFDIPFKG